MKLILITSLITLTFSCNNSQNGKIKKIGQTKIADTNKVGKVNGIVEPKSSAAIIDSALMQQKNYAQQRRIDMVIIKSQLVSLRGQMQIQKKNFQALQLSSVNGSVAMRNQQIAENTQHIVVLQKAIDSCYEVIENIKSGEKYELLDTAKKTKDST